MKQNISPLAAGILILALLIVVGFIWYRQTEPVPVNTGPVQSDAQRLRFGQDAAAMRKSFGALMKQAKEQDEQKAKQAAKKKEETTPTKQTE